MIFLKTERHYLI